MRDPEAPIDDIREFATRVQRYVDGLTFDDFIADTQAHDAVIRCLMVIGEAAKRTTPTVRAQYAEVAWEKAMGMRNRLAHEYEGINLHLVWETATEIIPRLLRALGQRRP